MECPWKIRWTFGQDLQCDLAPHLPEDRAVLKGGDPQHHAVLRDYAWPGSRSEMTWQAGDRREFTGDWPGPCTLLRGCVLHVGHHGKCAL